MDTFALRQFEWHDLPLKSFRVSEDAVELVVMLWSEEKGDYEDFCLRLLSPTSVRLDIGGEAQAKDLRDMEVAIFSFEEGPSSLLSGEIGILPGRGGYWTIAFRDARWSLCRVGGEGVVGV